MILEYAPKGELYTLLKTVGRFGNEQAPYKIGVHIKSYYFKTNQQFIKVHSSASGRVALLPLEESYPQGY
jgi:hypothetical protein